MVRVMFDSVESAADGLIAVMQYAKDTEDNFEFGPFILKELVASGMLLSGDTEGVVKALKKVSGAVLQGEAGRW